MQAKQQTQCLAQKWLSAAAAYPQTTSEEDGVTYVAGHQSSCIPANQDDGLVGEMAVNLGGERKLRVRPEPWPGAECRCARGADGGQPHLQHFASHGPDHVLQTLQHSHSTPVVQQVGGDRDDLKERERLPGQELSPQSSSLQAA